MPANVRPSWIDVVVDSRDTNIGTGPRLRDGWMQAVLSVRQLGDVLPLLDIEAIASHDKTSVLVRVTDNRTGKVIFEERFVQ